MYRDRIRELTPWRVYKLPDLEPMSWNGGPYGCFPIVDQPYLYKSSGTRIVLVNLDPDFSELMGFRRAYTATIEADDELLESIIEALLAWAR